MSILREVTGQKHKTVEELPFIQYLLNGEINESHYVIYLYEMLHIYRAIEGHSSDVGLLDGMEGIKRSAAIYQDLQELHPNYENELSPSTIVYLDYLKQLRESDLNKLLFAHVYVRHLGDLYGGKLISRNVPGSGKWYQFDDRPTLVKEFNSRLSLDLADEANKAFDYFECIFKELWIKTEGK
jgi:heme oxygenase